MKIKGKSFHGQKVLREEKLTKVLNTLLRFSILFVNFAVKIFVAEENCGGKTLYAFSVGYSCLPEDCIFVPFRGET